MAVLWPLDPRVPFTFLRCEPRQGLLKGIVSGAAIPLIRLRELLAVAVPVPSREEAQRLIEASAASSNHANIDRLTKEQAPPSAAQWA